jgi:pimeloyl-ACP methyl ester carboxylesterase
MSGLRISTAALFTVIALATTACGNPPTADAPAETAAAPAETAAAEVRSGNANVGDLRMYYEVQGSGRPLVLLHGGTATIDYSFAGMRPALAQRWTTFAVEQQAHGHTADIDRPLRFEQMADDTAAALRQLNIENADVFGWSDGGNVALGLAIRHPDLVRKVVVFGTNANNEGLRPEVWAMIQQAAAQDEAAGAGETPPGLREAHERAAPPGSTWPNLVAKVMDQAVAFEGWSPAQLRAIRAPVLVMIGDQDIVRPEHAVEMYQLIPNAELAVLPGTDHFAPVSEAPQVTALVTAFLDSPMPDAATAQ